MIGFLRGKLIAKQPPQLLIEVNGVGYEVDAPMTTFYDLPETGAEILLHTHLVVREDAHILFGFAKLSDRALFRSLIRISGVGPRMALGILSGMSADAFVRCIQENDSAALTRVPGVGKKTAERLVVELRDKLGKGDAGGVDFISATAKPANAVEEAVSALIALGYKPPDASRMVRGIESKDLSVEEIIRRALQAAAK
ncbi:MAG: Holliday junction branch migration protein RuvA [Gammaproteobacteria bacterium]|nr:Holliday junction branch migration protein RuvA [Gammaproteobacteria bacterium]